MKPAPFRYVRPETLGEAIDLLSSSQGEAKALAGGQSLVPLLNLRLARPALLVDIGFIPELKVLARAGEELVIGAGVRQHDAERSDLVREACALLPLALRYVGHVQTRHRGTIGGSLAHADPGAELPAVAVAVDASFVAVGPTGERLISAREFFRDAFRTALNADELLTEIRVPIRPGTRYAFLEVAGPELVAVAAAATPSETRLAAIGLGPTPLRLTKAGETERAGDLAAAVDEDVARSNRGRAITASARHTLQTLVARARALTEVAP
jgi:carbon-monoxide dehydrogenase medium subunit